MNQEKEDIKKLEDNEFSYHLGLYRSFGIFINNFCFNYSFINNCSLLESINIFKKSFFESQEQVENIVDIILKDIFKFFGFICGIKNNYFNYYENIYSYFKLYTEQNLYQFDFTLIKYLLALTEKKIDINSFLKFSNIENTYEKFDNIFNLGIFAQNITDSEKNNRNQEENDNRDVNDLPVGGDQFDFLSRFLNQHYNLNLNRNTKSQEESNIIMQWELLFQLLIFLLRENSCCYYSLINIYTEIISNQTKNDLFNEIKNNKYVMYDLKNLLQEKMILNIIKQGNFIDNQNLENDFDKYLMTLFKENNIYNQTLNEITYNKMNGETKIFFLKDECLKYLDCNNYIIPKEKSEAQKYILDFKKDVIKTFNYYFYKQSELTFEFFENAYEKVLLNKNNLEIIVKIFEILLNNDKILEHLDKISIRNSLLPIMLNLLQIFNVINTKSFIEFKLENKTIINKLYDLLSGFIKNTNDKNNVIDKDLEEYIKEILNQMNRYQLIYDSYNGDLSKLNMYDYNTNIIEYLKQNQKLNNNINIIPTKTDIINEKKQNIKNVKNKYKLLMQKKANNFMEKIKTNEEIMKTIDESINDIENIKNKDDEIMCFYCRTSIKLNSFEQPYSKLGLCANNFFYINSIKASLKDEFSKLGIFEENNQIYLYCFVYYR